MARLNIQQTVLTGINISECWANIQCDVAWEDAWSNDINCDGVWLFAKFRVGETPWRHVTLKTNSPDAFNRQDQTPFGCSSGENAAEQQIGLWVPESRKGAFLFRTRGEDAVRARRLQLLWDFSQERLTDVEQIDIRMFGVEMVYAPEDQHYVGDPLGANGPKNCLYTYPDGGAYLIQSEQAITLAAEPGCLYCDQDNERSRDDAPFEIPAAFPKGYNAFWYMKYGVNSRQYVEFLNTLTRRQQQTHVRSDISTDVIENYYVMTNTNIERFRQTIVCAKRGNGSEKPLRFYTYAPARACNAIAWKDVAAYAAWAGLRPITDLEFEKACRGPKIAVPSECAWGSSEIGRVETFDGPDGSGDEIKVPTSGLVNACFGCGIAPFEAAAGKTEPTNPGFLGPVSCGLFANTRHPDIPKRLNDGASYYGNLELSGNLWEFIVTLGHPNGRAFTGARGDGALDEDGYARVSSWPDETAAGTGARGGVYVSPDASYLAIALRFAGAHAKAEPRYNGGLRVGF